MSENIITVLRGFIIGISIAAPVGPIGVLCIRRTLSDGTLTGFLSGLGAATADMIYGAIAALGLTIIMDLLTAQVIWLKLAAGIFLLYLGSRTFLSKAGEHTAQASHNGLLGAYLSTFFLTLTNPATILSFIFIFASMIPPGAGRSPLLMVEGVFAGSALWWLALSFGVGLMRKRLSPNHMAWINRISGAILALFGVLSLLSLIQNIA